MYKLSRLLLILAVVFGCYSIALLVAMYWPQSLWVLLLVGVVLVKRRQRRVAQHLTTLGSARWASQNELRRAGLVGASSGLSVGHLLDDEQPPRKLDLMNNLFYWHVGSKDACRDFFAAFANKRGRGPLVRLPRAIHTAIFSPSGGGKGVSFVIPFLQTCADSCVVIDFKGENARITAEHRRRVFGHKIVLLDPYKQVTQHPDSLNPLAAIDKDDPEAIDAANDLANALVIRTPDEKDPHWNDGAIAWLSALIGMVVQYGNADEGTRSLQTVRDILSNPQKLEMAIKVMLESTACGGILARQGGQLMHYVDKEKSSTLTTISRHLKFLDSLAVGASTKTSSFNPAELCSGKVTVYLILPPNHMRAQSSLLRMWIGSMLRAVVSGGMQERNMVHFILDEAASLGHLEAIDDAVDKYRAYSIRLQFYFQSMGQLKKCFPEGQEQTLLSNTTQIFFGVNDHGLAGGVGTADYVSARLGEQTILVNSGGTSVGKSSQWSSGGGQSSSGGGRSQNANDNWQQQARKLLQPAEIVALSPRVAITFTPGVSPIYTWLSRYYEERPEARPSLSTRTATACRTFVVAALLCIASFGVAVQVTQRYSELQAERRAAAEQQYQREIFKNVPPEVPVEPDDVFTRSSHVDRRPIVPEPQRDRSRR